jgi:hypothetical protein
VQILSHDLPACKARRSLRFRCVRWRDGQIVADQHMMTRQARRWPLGLAVLAIGVTACTEESAPSFSTPITITLSAKSADTTGGMVSTEKSISAEEGNPYGTFIINARLRGRRDPRRIGIEAATLSLGPGSVGVGSLGDVFDGTTEVLVRLNGTGTDYPVGEVDIAPLTIGEVRLTAHFNDMMPDADVARMVNADFKIMVRGKATTGFTGKGSEAVLKTTLTFSSYQ